ncbi:O-antigen ligase family protein [Dactylosporangium sp. NBC_01737]|nr:O-antigen ligase family protein [Dactylosporangium sp. NBC_01737]
MRTPTLRARPGGPTHFRTIWDSTDHRWSLLAAAVGGGSVVEPTLTLRWGAAACAVVLLLHLRQLRPALPDVAAVALTLYATMSLNWTVDAAGTLLAVQNQWAALAVFVTVRLVVTDAAKLRFVVAGYVAGAVYGVTLIVVQNLHVLTLSRTSGARYGIDGLNYNYLGYALALGAVMIVVLSRMVANPAARFPLVLPLAGLTLGVVWCGSRAAFLGMACAAVWLLVWRTARRIGVGVLATVMLALALAVAYGSIDDTLNALDGVSGRATGDIAGRLTTWPIARDVIAEHFWFGLGSASFRFVNPFGIGAHNVVLELGAGLGAVGVVLFLGTIYAAVVHATRDADPSVRAPLVGAFILVSGPIYMSGHWELSPAAWVALAICSRLTLLRPAPSAGPVSVLSKPVSSVSSASCAGVSRRSGG